MKEKKLLRTEFYRPRSAGPKTEPVNPDSPPIQQRSFLMRLRLLRIILRPTLNPKLATELARSSSKIALAWLLWRRS
jgi:hypothetical protein